jgi:hypothetical protein
MASSVKCAATSKMDMVSGPYLRCRLAPLADRRVAIESATTHRISNMRLAPLRAVCPVGSKGGNTSSNRRRNCGTVKAGDFFQPDFEPPKEDMCQQGRQYMVMSPLIRAHFIVIHLHVGFALFKTLLNAPAPPAKRQRLGAGTDRDRSLGAIDETYRRVYDAVGCGWAGRARRCPRQLSDVAWPYGRHHRQGW